MNSIDVQNNNLDTAFLFQKEYLIREMEKISVSLNDKQVRQFVTYFKLLIEWNKVMNLTGITEYREVVKKHFVDSVISSGWHDFSFPQTVLDLGTGAGFPGIPLKILFPELKITLLDSLNKRIQFLNTVIKHLKLDNIAAIHGRAEDFAKKPLYREQFDVCVSRAVSNLSTLLEYSLPYIKEEGIFISYKSKDIKSEINNSKYALEVLGGCIKEIHKFYLPDSDISRSIVVINKTHKTPDKYPRKAGLPAKKPLYSE